MAQTRRGKKTVKIIIYYSLFLLLLPLFAEVFYRLTSFAKSCRSTCDSTLLTKTFEFNLTAFRKPEFTIYDREIGFDLVAGSSVTGIRNGVDRPNWGFSINNKKLRKSVKNNAPAKVLTVGDSFTFGDQVNNDQTWQSCLNKNQTQIELLNGGVGGYGSLQALKRAGRLLKENRYNGLILSIVSYDDIIRDRMDYMMGFPSPSLIRDQKGNFAFAPAPSPNMAGSKFSPMENSSPNKLESFIYKYSLLANKINPRFYQIQARQLTRYASNNASNREVIEEIIKKINELSTKHKIPAMVIIQYGNNRHSFYINARKQLLGQLNERDINYVDTWEAVNHPQDRSLVWRNHHTPYGNQIVCEHILSSPAFNKFLEQVDA